MRPTTAQRLFTITLITSRATAQTTLDSFDIPHCALECFVLALDDDGCASETDFSCHCSKGLIITTAKSCVMKSCDTADENAAFAAVKKGCEDVGVNIGNGGDGADGGDSSSAPRSTMTASLIWSTTTSMPISSANPRSSVMVPSSLSSSFSSSPQASPISSSNPTGAPLKSSIPASPAPTTLYSSTMRTTSLRTSTSPLQPTDTPFALLSPAPSLSRAAKAGIAASVAVFVLIITSIALYIRRLKRDLREAKAAAGIPESVWRASISTAAAPGNISRRKSWQGLRPSRSFRRSDDGQNDAGELRRDHSGKGLTLKKRGHVLSVVVERAEEEEQDEEAQAMVHEPVPGQKEGLADALELDGEFTGVVEAPLSITPKTRSRANSSEPGRISGERLRYA